MGEPWWANVKAGDRVRPSGMAMNAGGPDPIGRVLAVIPGKPWPAVVVILPGGVVRTWRRWALVASDD